MQYLNSVPDLPHISDIASIKILSHSIIALFCITGIFSVVKIKSIKDWAKLFRYYKDKISTNFPVIPDMAKNNLLETDHKSANCNNY